MRMRYLVQMRHHVHAHIPVRVHERLVGGRRVEGHEDTPLLAQVHLLLVPVKQGIVDKCVTVVYSSDGTGRNSFTLTSERLTAAFL
jgi:hypothetical protein